eukprot:1151146-Rhodomonas_salina.1
MVAQCEGQCERVVESREGMGERERRGACARLHWTAGRGRTAERTGGGVHAGVGRAGRFAEPECHGRSDIQSGESSIPVCSLSMRRCCSALHFVTRRLFQDIVDISAESQGSAKKKERERPGKRESFLKKIAGPLLARCGTKEAVADDDRYGLSSDSAPEASSAEDSDFDPEEGDRQPDEESPREAIAAVWLLAGGRVLVEDDDGDSECLLPRPFCSSSLPPSFLAARPHTFSSSPSSSTPPPPQLQVTSTSSSRRRRTKPSLGILSALILNPRLLRHVRYSHSAE